MVYVLCAVIFIGSIMLYFQVEERPLWAPVVGALLFLFPIRMHLKRIAVKLILEGTHLTLQTGLLSKTTRTLDLAKVQDVTVRQSVGQRMLGTGDVSVETAGERSGMTLANFDGPKALADLILRAHDAGRPSSL